MKKYVLIERIVIIVAAAVALAQTIIGNLSTGIGLLALGGFVFLFGYRSRRRLFSLEGCLQDEVKTLVSEGLNHVAIRWAESTSRALWVDGSYRARAEIGALAIRAADAIGIEAIRHKIRAMIDDCGWTSVEMGMLKEGERWLREGIQLAQDHNYPYMKAKGLRHLGGKHLRNHDLATAEHTLQEAFDATAGLPDGPEKDELLAEWYYAQGVLFLAQGDLAKAARSVSEAEKEYTRLPNKEWRAKIQVRKGEIEFRSGDAAKALGIFSEAKAVASEHHYKRVLVKSRLWLAKVYLELNQVAEAKAELHAIHKEIKESDMLQEQKELASLHASLRQRHLVTP